MTWQRRLTRAIRERKRDALGYPEFVRAAVAVLVREEQSGPVIPLTVRAPHLRTHSGQIAFPGGKTDAGETVQQAALREAQEELGIDPSAVDVIGLLDDVPTPTGFLISPVVGVLRQHEYRINESEVSEVFELPLDLLFYDHAREDHGIRHYRGRDYRRLAYYYGEHRVWGATARILEQMATLISDLE